MTDAETLSFIREEVRRQVQVVLYGQSGATTSQTEDIEAMLPGMDTQVNRPISHPYGFVSRAPRGKLSVVARIGDHPSNRVTIGHRDEERPEVEVGESAMYSVDGYQVLVKLDRIEVSKDGESETLVVGETLSELIGGLLDALALHTHAAPGAPPSNATTYVQLKGDFVSNGKILAKDGGRF
jgi:phage gp45-like